MQPYNKAESRTSTVHRLPLLRLEVSNYLRGIWMYISIFLCLNNTQVVDEIYRKLPEVNRLQTPTKFHWTLRAYTTSGAISRCSSLHLWAAQNLYRYSNPHLATLHDNCTYFNGIQQICKTTNLCRQSIIVLFNFFTALLCASEINEIYLNNSSQLQKKKKNPKAYMTNCIWLA